MTDIVEKLRDLARVAEDVPPDFQQIQWLLDAADEIERLRALVREVFDGLDEYWIKRPEGVSWVVRASEALHND